MLRQFSFGASSLPPNQSSVKGAKITEIEDTHINIVTLLYSVALLYSVVLTRAILIVSALPHR